MYLLVYSNFKWLVIISLIVCGECAKLSSLDKTYQKGVKAYSEERWSQCIAQFEESLHLYKLFKSIIVNCRLKCNSLNYESQVKENLENLKFYEVFFNIRNCLKKCQEKEFETVFLKNSIDDSTLFSMQARKPYEYLHVCYFQMNALPKAASAVYTYLVANPNNVEMKNNLKYYLEQSEVDAKEVVDLLSEDYIISYNLGLQSYEKSNWGETIASMEEVFKDYLTWENSCRAECERQPEQEWSPEFVITVSNNIASLLNCRQHCQEKLKPLGYDSGIDFLAEILNYLQISYYRLDRFKDAAAAATSYLALLPDDEDMITNKEIYGTLVDYDAFVVRSDVLHYLKRDTYEKKLLNIFHQGNTDFDSNAL